MIALLSLLIACSGSKTEEPAAKPEEPAKVEEAAPAPTESAKAEPLPTGEPVTSEVQLVTRQGEPPETTILLKLWDGDKLDNVSLGKFPGNCTQEAPAAGVTAAPADGKLYHVKCWWAGSGDEVTITQQGGSLVVTKVQVDEANAAPGAPEELRRVPVPGGRPVTYKAGGAPAPGTPSAPAGGGTGSAAPAGDGH